MTLNEHNFLRFSDSQGDTGILPTGAISEFCNYCPFFTLNEDFITVINLTNPPVLSSGAIFSIGLFEDKTGDDYSQYIEITEIDGINTISAYQTIDVTASIPEGHYTAYLGYNNILPDPDLCFGLTWVVIGDAVQGTCEIYIPGSDSGVLTGSADSAPFQVSTSKCVIHADVEITDTPVYARIVIKQGGTPLHTFDVLAGGTFSFNVSDLPVNQDITITLEGQTNDLEDRVTFNSVNVVELNIESSCLFYTEDPEKLSETVLLRYRNEDNIYYYDYDHLPDNFFNQLRIYLINKGAQFPKDFEEYKESTTGITRNYNPNSAREFEMNTPQMDPASLEALSAILDHSSILLNGRPYVLKNSYDINYNDETDFGWAEFTLIDQDYAGLNKAGEQVI